MTQLMHLHLDKTGHQDPPTPPPTLPVFTFPYTLQLANQLLSGFLYLITLRAMAQGTPRHRTPMSGYIIQIILNARCLEQMDAQVKDCYIFSPVVHEKVTFRNARIAPGT